MCLTDYFSKIKPSLASEIREAPSKFNDYSTPSEQISNLSEVSCLEIFNLIRKMPGNTACGLDNISARLLKEAAPIVARS